MPRRFLALVVTLGFLAAPAAAQQAGQASPPPAGGQAEPSSPVVSTAEAALGRAKGTILDEIIVKVNGDIFTKSDLERDQIIALQNQNPNQPILNPEDLQNDAKLKAALTQVTPGILVNEVNTLLMVQRGRELGFHLTDDQFTHAVDALKKDNNITSDEQFQAALKQQGMTMADLRSEMEKTAIIQQVQQQEIMPKLQITDQEAHEYYDAHHGDFMKPATAMIREILVEAPVETRNGQQVINAGADDAALAKAKAARDRVEKGESFAAVAADVSDSPTKSNGGLAGPINLSDLAPELRGIIEKLKPGEVSEPIRTQRGYQLLELESMTPATLQPFDQVRDQITMKVQSQRVQTETRTYVDKLRSDAIIEWENPDFKKMYEAALVAGPPACVAVFQYSPASQVFVVSFHEVP